MHFSKMDDNGKWHEIYDADELSEMLHNTIDYYLDMARKEKNRGDMTLEEAKKQVKNEYEEENKQLKKDAELVYLRFNSYKERDAYRAFQEKHSVCRRTNRINSEKMAYLIPYGTGIGTALTVICPICGEKQDITDYNIW